MFIFLCLECCHAVKYTNGPKTSTYLMVADLWLCGNPVYMAPTGTVWPFIFRNCKELFWSFGHLTEGGFLEGNIRSRNGSKVTCPHEEYFWMMKQDGGKWETFDNILVDCAEK